MQKNRFSLVGVVLSLLFFLSLPLYAQYDAYIEKYKDNKICADSSVCHLFEKALKLKKMMLTSSGKIEIEKSKIECEKITESSRALKEKIDKLMEGL